MMTDETRPMQSLSYGRNLLSQPSSCRFIRPTFTSFISVRLVERGKRSEPNGTGGIWKGMRKG